jgi:hypothetical protein
VIRQVIVDVVSAEKRPVGHADGRHEGGGQSQEPDHQLERQTEDGPRATRVVRQGIAQAHLPPESAPEADRHHAGLLERDDGDHQRADQEQGRRAGPRGEEEHRYVDVGDRRAPGSRDEPPQEQTDQRRQDDERDRLVEQIGVGQVDEGAPEIPHGGGERIGRAAIRSSCGRGHVLSGRFRETGRF